MAGPILGWNFSEGHLHDERLLAALQRRPPVRSRGPPPVDGQDSMSTNIVVGSEPRTGRRSDSGRERRSRHRGRSSRHPRRGYPHQRADPARPAARRLSGAQHHDRHLLAHSEQPLAYYGLRRKYPDLDMAHPFDDGSAALLGTSIEDTADGLDDVFRPIDHLSRHPIYVPAFGAQALL